MLKERRMFGTPIDYNYSDKKQIIKIAQSHCSSQCSNTNQHEAEITIKFIGNVQQNINQIVNTLKCSEICREEVKNILIIYANKIDKLREERNLYKELLYAKEEQEMQQIQLLKEQIKHLETELEHQPKYQQKCSCFNDNQSDRFAMFRHQINDYKFNSTSTMMHQPQQSINLKIKSELLPARQPTIQAEINDEQEQMLMGGSDSEDMSKQLDSLQISESIKLPSENTMNSISEDELMKLMLKYNINTEELQQIFQQYEKEHKQVDELFDSDRQRELYRLGQKMQKDLWNKKVMKDVKKLSSLKQNQC